MFPNFRSVSLPKIRQIISRSIVYSSRHLWRQKTGKIENSVWHCFLAAKWTVGICGISAQCFRGTRGSGYLFLPSFMTLWHGNRMIAWRSAPKVDKVFYSNLTRAGVQRPGPSLLSFLAFSFGSKWRCFHETRRRPTNKRPVISSPVSREAYRLRIKMKTNVSKEVWELLNSRR